MFVVYVTFSIAGWVALAVFLTYWALHHFRRRALNRKTLKPVEAHEKLP